MVKIGLKAFQLVLLNSKICVMISFVVFFVHFLYSTLSRARKIYEKANPPMVQFSQDYLEIKICK